MGWSRNPSTPTTALFSLSIVTTVGNGQNAKFWTDHWLHGSCLEDFAPVFKFVPLRLRKARTVSEALQDNTWVAVIRGALGWHGLAEYLVLWDILNEWNLDITDDMHQWKFDISGIFFSTRSAYINFFIG